jgi:hypothetical protein
MINPPAAAWHPSGSYALVLNATDTVHRYDPIAKTLTNVGSAGSTVSWRAITFAPGGAKAVLLGNTATEGRIYLWDDASAQLTLMSAETFAGGTYEAIQWSPSGTESRVLASKKVSSSSYAAYLWPFDVSMGRATAQGFTHTTSAGCQDLAWTTDAFNLPAISVVCGVNGVDLFHIDGNGNFVRYTGNAGNTSRISGRPQGDYALAVGWTSPRLYRYQQGNWNTDFYNPWYSTIYAVRFSTDGSRALALGQAVGSPMVGRVAEFRHDLFTQAEFTDVSIPNFSLPPYNATSGVSLNDAAWRPGCDGGLLVGGANTITAQKAHVIRFSVDNGTLCAN